jgi:hypothetical protein
VKEQRGSANASEYTTKWKNETFHSFGDHQIYDRSGWHGKSGNGTQRALGRDNRGKRDLSEKKKGGLGE